MNYKVLAMVALISMAIGAALDRFGMPAKTVTTTALEVEKNKDTHKTTIIEKSPDGKETTTITEDTKATTNLTKDTSIKVLAKPSINVSGLVGVDSMNSFKPLYGISLSKEFIGPITAGAWGLTNGTFGVSIGINF